MKFAGPIIAVSNMEASKKFYTELFHQEIGMDLGENVGFISGLSLQYNYAGLAGIDPESVIKKSHNFELYFEEEDFDAFMEKLEKRPDIVYVHRVKKYPWQQRVIRIYDPDMHIIEIGEGMAFIVRRYLAEGKTVAETAQLMMSPVEYVQAIADNKL
jgi:catechol 2,3-dioxygenase-like lactoylglutathione lyase family enzyme